MTSSHSKHNIVQVELLYVIGQVFTQ